MGIRIPFAALAAALLLSACDDPSSGPITVSVIGAPPTLGNPNLEPLTAPSAFLAEAVAQGLVRFDATGQIEPALAQSWIVSDDGLRYTFRLRPAQWANGAEVTAEQVAERLSAAGSRASRNPLKPLLGAISEVEAMTDDVLEISLVSPRPNFLQLLAQPEMAILRNRLGTGPYRATARESAIALELPPAESGEQAQAGTEASLLLRAEPAPLAVARFGAGLTDLVTGGTVGDLPIARAARPPAAILAFDPAAGLFGLAVVDEDRPLAEAELRRALSMAIDRQALVAALNVPELQPRASLLPPGIDEYPRPANPDWAANPLPARRSAAAQAIAAAEGEQPLTVRVAMPDEPGYRLVFAHLKRDWQAIGVVAERVGAEADADLRLVDAIAPAELASWYLRRFACESSAICSGEADAALEAARIAPALAERQAQLANADRILNELAPFIPLAAPVRWSLVSPRLTGFRPNVFGRHFAGALVAGPR